ncbi:MAG: hypothetical protein R3344_07110, partial [Acidobacteriota bacterium]|nr:hypothetical protein [Acidobacteriota bacterium]
MGYDVFAGWAEESVWGTPVARTQFARAYEDAFLRHEVPQNPVTFLGSRDPEQVFSQIERGIGELHIPLVYDGMGKLLKHCMGLVTDAGSGPYTHTHDLDDNPFTRAASPLVGLTAELHYGLPDSSLESFLLYGGRVRQFGSNMRINEEVKLDV